VAEKNKTDKPRSRRDYRLVVADMQSGGIEFSKDRYAFNRTDVSH
jgi:hypothetical protein